jgi:hypothetical protein
LFFALRGRAQLQRFAAERRQLELERQLFADRERLHRQIEVRDPFPPTVRTHHDLPLPPLPHPTTYLPPRPAHLPKAEERQRGLDRQREFLRAAEAAAAARRRLAAEERRKQVEARRAASAAAVERMSSATTASIESAKKVREDAKYATKSTSIVDYWAEKNHVMSPLDKERSPPPRHLQVRSGGGAGAITGWLSY